MYGSIVSYNSDIIKVFPHAALSHDSVISYAKYLKFRYLNSISDDDRILSDIYIELAIINSENISSSEADEFTKKSFHGHTKEILQKKTPIALEDILKPGKNGRPVQRVLVEGAPGVGKSTFAWHLCWKWAQKLETLKHFNLVVLVQLRAKRAQEAKQLRDLFPLSRKNSIEHVLATIEHGEGVLIVLDGFDELPREQRQEGSVYMNLIKREELPNATVITTSRPSVSAYIIKKYPKHVHRRLEILGFTERKVEEYASKFEFRDATCRTKFLQYINGNPVIKGMMYLPLNALFVARIFEDNCKANSPYPKTMTQLYDALIRSLIRRHLAVPDDYSMPKSLMCREDIDSLPHAVATQLLVIARIAYEGLCDEKYVFTDLDGSKFDHLGMMKKTTSLDDTAVGPTYTFSFLHLTLQEYLSALHLSLGQSYNKNIALRLLSWIWTCCIRPLWYTSPDIPHLVQRDIVLRFLAGLCKHSTSFSCQQVGDVLAHVSINEEHDFLHITRERKSFIQFIRCLYESDAIIKESHKAQDFFDSEEMIETFGLSPFDDYLIGHCISCHGGVWYVDIDQLDLFVQGLKSCNGSKRGKLKILHIYHTDLELLTLDPVLLTSVLESISFDSVTFSASSVAVLQQYISSNASLKRFYVFYSMHVELLLPIVFGPSSLEMIDLRADKLLIDNHTIVNLLMNNSNLKELYLALELPTLCDNTSLKYLANHIRIFLDLAIKWNITEQKITVKHIYHSVCVMEITHSSKKIVDVYLDDMFHYEHCDSYNSTAHQLLLLHIPEQYHNYIRTR